jgi:hypothetical protein
MIHLSFNLSNPFSNRFGGVYEKFGKTWMPHKFWEFNIYKDNSIFKGSFKFSIREDHAGFEFDFGLLGWSVEYRFYDSRHWNYENDCWETYE